MGWPYCAAAFVCTLFGSVSCRPMDVAAWYPRAKRVDRNTWRAGLQSAVRAMRHPGTQNCRTIFSLRLRLVAGSCCRACCRSRAFGGTVRLGQSLWQIPRFVCGAAKDCASVVVLT